MPTYEYECKSCGHISEVFHRMTAKPRVKCTVCGGSTRKLIGTGAGIIFKGTGFYETDYKRKCSPRNGEAKPHRVEGQSSGESNGVAGESKKSVGKNTES